MWTWSPHSRPSQWGPPWVWFQNPYCCCCLQAAPFYIWKAEAFFFSLNHHKWQDAFYSGRVHHSDGQKSYLMLNYSYVS